MNGTENQITWANEIQAGMIEDCNSIINKITTRLNSPEYDPEYDGKRIDILAGVEYLNATIADIQEMD